MSFDTKLKWDQSTERLYETGVRRGVLYLKNDDGTYSNGIAWNGLVSITESPSGAESNPIYADDMKYLDIRSAEQFGATIQAYTYPEQFEQCDGSASILAAGTPNFVTIGQQSRRAFALCYTTKVGNDVMFNDFSYKIHIIYGCTASPSEREYQTVNENPEAITFSWEVATTPLELPTAMGAFKPTANLTIDVSRLSKIETAAEREWYLSKVEDLEKKLYGVAGTGGSEPELVLPEDIPELIPIYKAG